MSTSEYYQMLNRYRLQQGWTWQDMVDRLGAGRSRFVTAAVGRGGGFRREFSELEEVVEAELVDPPGPGVNPSAVVVDWMTAGGDSRAEVYRPYYDEKDERGHPVNYCPYSGIRLQRSCRHCGSALPRLIEPSTRFCANCGDALPLNVTLSDIQLNNYWVIFRGDRHPFQLRRYFSLPGSHFARRILASPDPEITLTLDGGSHRVAIHWRGAQRVQPMSEG